MIKAKIDVKKNISLNFIFRIIGMIFNYFSIPIILNYLGATNYGLWITIYSVINWINNFDVGIGNGLKNKLSEAIALKDYNKAKKYIATSYILITIVSFILLIITLIALNVIDLGSLFNTNVIEDKHLFNIILLMVILTLVNFIISLYKQLLYSVDLSSFVGISYFVYQLLIIIVISALNLFTQGSIQALVLVYGILNIIIGIYFTIIFFKNHSELFPKLKYVDLLMIKDIMGISFDFFLIQFSMIIIFTTDNLIITNFIGPEAVTSYSIILRIFQMFIYLYGFILAPFWSLYTKAYVNREVDWIIKTLNKFKKLFFATILIIIAVVLGINLLLKIWLGHILEYPKFLPLFCAVFSMIKIYADIYATLINGMGKTKIQLMLMVIGAIVNIPLSIYFIKIGFNASGVILATNISLLPFIVIMPIYSNIILKKLKDK